MKTQEGRKPVVFPGQVQEYHGWDRHVTGSTGQVDLLQLSGWNGLIMDHSKTPLHSLHRVGAHGSDAKYTRPASSDIFAWTLQGRVGHTRGRSEH